VEPPQPDEPLSRRAADADDVDEPLEALARLPPKLPEPLELDFPELKPDGFPMASTKGAVMRAAEIAARMRCFFKMPSNIEDYLQYITKRRKVKYTQPSG
jgi:hypothetical protein